MSVASQTPRPIISSVSYVETFGTITRAYVIRHKQSGKSAGYGFVEMMSGEQASRAVAALNGARFQGNCLRLFVMPAVAISAQS